MKSCFKKRCWFKNFPSKWYLRKQLNNVWPFGRVFETSSGFHGEFITLDTRKLSLLLRKIVNGEANDRVQKLDRGGLVIHFTHSTP